MFCYVLLLLIECKCIFVPMEWDHGRSQSFNNEILTLQLNIYNTSFCDYTGRPTYLVIQTVFDVYIFLYFLILCFYYFCYLYSIILFPFYVSVTIYLNCLYYLATCILLNCYLVRLKKKISLFI